MKSKKAGVLQEQIIFWILNIVFFSLILVFAVRTGSHTGIMEETYAKQIALTIDSMDKNMEVEMDLSELYKIAEKNDFKGELFFLEKDKNIIIVTAGKGEGYRYRYFSDLDFDFILTQDKKLRLSTMEGQDAS